MPAPSLLTKRLLLRHWKESDLPLFAKMNSDTRVMEYFPLILSKKESDSLAEKIQKELKEKEYGFWAVEVIGLAPFIGFVGLHYPDFKAPFTPCVEIGWRLAYEQWGKGYAFEAASKVIDYAFNTLNLQELVSFTTVKNKRSRKLMEKLGMTHNPSDDFAHPKLQKNHPLCPHVLYRKRNPHNENISHLPQIIR
ncbi:MAG: GNAT family N-acetyltransferase [Chlamydiae bacterium CG10_big_fil_rev_8_21_14_0_10_35_9]|nr:MAG: GNAT family N-acetyltransferase [Chlamydiae bacterium CG10_big_fil_rev_8_21_14_0_10_35_9]